MLAKSRVTGIEPGIPDQINEACQRNTSCATHLLHGCSREPGRRPPRSPCERRGKSSATGVSAGRAAENIAAHVRVGLEGWSQHMSD
jgi:hypothetical protein